MARLLVGNFEFEHQLAPGTTRARETAIAGALACCWWPVCEPGDWILADSEPDLGPPAPLLTLGLPRPDYAYRAAARLPDGLRLEPWGWSGAVVALARRLGTAHSAPPLDVVRHFNRRSTRCRLELEWNCGPPGLCVVGSIAEVERHLTRPEFAGGWLIKADFGMAGRERIAGRTAVLSPAQTAWLARRLSEQGVAVLEPWLERIDEAGLQFEIPPRGAPRFLGATPLLTDPRGTYRGSRIDPQTLPDPLWAPAIEIASRVADRLATAGYHGPLGIDAMRYRDPTGAVHTRPLQDLNVRWTMGRLALGWRRFLNEQSFASWLHCGWPPGAGFADWIGKLRDRWPPGVEAIVTSPDHFTRQSLLVSAPHRDLRTDAETIFYAAIAERPHTLMNGGQATSRT